MTEKTEKTEPSGDYSGVERRALRNSGGNVNYYLLDIKHPKRLAPGTVECEDVIAALGMTFEEGCAFKALWRRCAARTLGQQKLSYDGGVYDAEKLLHYAGRIVFLDKVAAPYTPPMHHIKESPITMIEPETTKTFEVAPAPNLVRNIDDYQRLAIRTAPEGEALLAGLNHAALGLLTEPGEYVTEAKRMLVYRKPRDDKMRKHMSEELGDGAWYVALACTHLDIPMGKLAFFTGTHTQPLDLNEIVLGLGAAMGRFVGNVEAVVVNGQPLDTAMRLSMRFNLNEIMRFTAAACVENGGGLLGVLQENVDKLCLRFPGKFSAAAAEARADKGGLDASQS